MAKSILSRKRDLLYLVFFIIHIPVMLCVDLTPLYPISLKPQFMIDLRKWYIVTYSDQFFVSPPKWFELYMWLEALLHLPVSFWAIGALIRNEPKVPLVLLLFAAETVLTTLTCVADLMSWEEASTDVKKGLAGLYLPYLGLGLFMLIDTTERISGRLTPVNSRLLAKKKV